MVLFSSVDMKPYSAPQPIVMRNNVFFCYALVAKKKWLHWFQSFFHPTAYMKNVACHMSVSSKFQKIKLHFLKQRFNIIISLLLLTKCIIYITKTRKDQQHKLSLRARRAAALNSTSNKLNHSV